MSKPEYQEIEIVGNAVEIASFRMHMQQMTDYIVEETPLRIRVVADRSEFPFLNQFNRETRTLANGKVFIFLKDSDINGNLGGLARSLNN